MPLTSLYKWEEHNHGLDHKCGTCSTVLSSPRARKTCFGKHEEVCSRYHKTLFFLGQSHHCEACHKTIELHHKRHCEIGSIMQKIRYIDDCFSNTLYHANQRRKAKRRASIENSSPNDEEEEEEEESAFDAESSEWNDSSIQNDDEVGFRKGEIWYHGLDTAAERKTLKAARRLARNQTRFELPTALDLGHIEHVLHPESQAMPSKEIADVDGTGNGTSPMATDLVSNNHSLNWSSLRKDVYDKTSRKQPSSSPNGVTRPLGNMDAIQDILKVFGIELAPARNSKERKTLLSKLQVAIRTDLVAHSNEQAETMQRMAGYWRYANRRTYNFMVRTNQVWDWETGEKLLEVEDEGVAEDDGEDEDNLSGTTQVTTDSQSQDDDQGLKLIVDEGGGCSKSTLPDVYDASDEPGNQVRKDDRVLEKTIRPASPPRDTGPSPSLRYCTLKKVPKLKSRSITKAQDISPNAFSALKFEIPAPCEDPQLPTKEEAIFQRAEPKALVKGQEESFPPLTSIEAMTDTPSKAPPKQRKVLNIIATPRAGSPVSHPVRTSKSKRTDGAKRLVHIGIVAKHASGDTARDKIASDSWTDVVKGKKGRK